MKANKKILGYTQRLLDDFFYSYPKAKVMQTGYELPCEDLLCKNTVNKLFSASFCPSNLTCTNSLFIWFQRIHHAALSAKYPASQYSAIDLLGTVQKAAGVA